MPDVPSAQGVAASLRHLFRNLEYQEDRHVPTDRVWVEIAAIIEADRERIRAAERERACAILDPPADHAWAAPIHLFLATRKRLIKAPDQKGGSD